MLADLEWLDGRPVEVSPRTILHCQLGRLRDRGLVAYAGTELELDLEDVCRNNSYLDPEADHVPRRHSDAVALFAAEASPARLGFGNEVVEHCAHNARVELAAFGAAVTDWELKRGFERL